MYSYTNACIRDRKHNPDGLCHRRWHWRVMSNLNCDQTAVIGTVLLSCLG